jgi:molybdopterin synthase catalytic subunit
MTVRVLFFGLLKDLAERASDSVELPETATLADLLRHYEARIPKIKDMLSSVAVSINQEYARPSDRLHADDEVALLPPVSGGAARTEHCEIVREKIDTQRIAESMKRGEDGAMAVFEGIVRNNTRGRRTFYLEYEAYEEMALKKMEELAKQALADFKIRDVALVHRLGRLEISETSVLIVVASGHRGPAFEACRWLIDTLKRTVPIWKKEYFEDGAVWADGDPFPDNIPRAQATPGAGEASN